MAAAPAYAQEETEAEEVTPSANEEAGETEPAEADDDDEAETAEAEKLLNISGRFEIGADAVWADDENDLDFDQWLTLKVESPPDSVQFL